RELRQRRISKRNQLVSHGVIKTVQEGDSLRCNRCDCSTDYAELKNNHQYRSQYRIQHNCNQHDPHRCLTVTERPENSIEEVVGEHEEHAQKTDLKVYFRLIQNRLRCSKEQKKIRRKYVTKETETDGHHRHDNDKCI